MTISTNTEVGFFGTQATVSAGGGTAIVADQQFSVQADIVSWTNTEHALWAGFALRFEFASGTMNTNGVNLFARMLGIDGTNDAPIPDAAYTNMHIGNFVTDLSHATNTLQSYPMQWAYIGGMQDAQAIEFYIQANCGVPLSAGWTLIIIPSARGPHA